MNNTGSNDEGYPPPGYTNTPNASAGIPPAQRPLNSTLNVPINPNMLILPILEYVCGETQVRFYYRHGDYVSVSDIMRLLSKCTSTPDMLLRKLLENGVLRPTEKADVLEVV